MQKCQRLWGISWGWDMHACTNSHMHAHMGELSINTWMPPIKVLQCLFIVFPSFLLHVSVGLCTVWPFCQDFNLKRQSWLNNGQIKIYIKKIRQNTHSQFHISALRWSQQATLSHIRGTDTQTHSKIFSKNWRPSHRQWCTWQNIRFNLFLFPGLIQHLASNTNSNCSHSLTQTLALNMWPKTRTTCTSADLEY